MIGIYLFDIDKDRIDILIDELPKPLIALLETHSLSRPRKTTIRMNDYNPQQAIRITAHKRKKDSK